MFNVLIVDDEKIVTDGLAEYVEWAKMGFQVAGVANSANEALEIISRVKVDVILTDIIMENKTGIQLIEEALAIDKNIKYVLLSGHEEFSYAKQALALGVCEYLVKPVDFDELEETFKKIYNLIEEEQEKRLVEVKYKILSQYMDPQLGLMSYDEFKNTSKGNNDVLGEVLYKQIQYYMKQRDFITLTQRFLELLKDINNKKETLEERAYHLTIIGIIAIKEYCAENNIIYKETYTDDELLKKLIGFEKMNEISDFLRGYIEEIHSKLEDNKEKEALAEGRIIHIIKEYIEGHYSENLNLNFLAEKVYVHPTYLSILFKKQTGENFTEYLSKIRIKNAEKLLKDMSLRIADISQMVGYDSSKHFSKIFKQLTGTTPKDYRNKLE